MEESAWWRTEVIYQIYPRSFQDTNGDGVGDLNGIASRLRHLADLGIDALWDFADIPVTDEGLRLRHYRLLRHSSAFRLSFGL